MRSSYVNFPVKEMVRIVLLLSAYSYMRLNHRRILVNSSFFIDMRAGAQRLLGDKLPLCKFWMISLQRVKDRCSALRDFRSCNEPLVLNKIGPARGDGSWVMDCFSFVEPTLFQWIPITQPDRLSLLLFHSLFSNNVTLGKYKNSRFIYSRTNLK